MISFIYAITLFMGDERSPVMAFALSVALALVALIGVQGRPIPHLKFRLPAWPWGDITKFGVLVAIAVIAGLSGTEMERQKALQAQANAQAAASQEAARLVDAKLKPAGACPHQMPPRQEIARRQTNRRDRLAKPL
jgi:hypothetical protein